MKVKDLSNLAALLMPEGTADPARQETAKKAKRVARVAPLDIPLLVPPQCVRHRQTTSAHINSGHPNTSELNYL